MRRILITALLLPGLFCPSANAYGPRGHKMVGAIADKRLSGQATATKINQLLDGISLADAALLPDQIKTWDRQPNAPIATLAGHDNLRDQLRDFVNANPDHGATAHHPSHHWFHFVDVPVGGTSLYESGPVGRSDSDVVQMISYCIAVVRGEEDENNDRKITKPVALILLSHYVGDIHQPLHVGAQYFNASGQPSNPDQGGQALGDQGGNNLHLLFHPAAVPPAHAGSRPLELHGYWDDDAVNVAVSLLKADTALHIPPHANDTQIAALLATHTPTGWEMTEPDVTKWSVLWANEIMPTANKAHSDLQYQSIQVHGQAVKGDAVANGSTYPKWAGGVVKDELHKAGWRLADLLTRIL
ncbi:MAG TPA: S1/P1 nuclease [Planctomycetaceae bacterium]|nr:S1/P1 nuclease [Planctomycetaceae bacterium]